MLNHKLLISILFMLPSAGISSDELRPEQHYEYAKEAYEHNACNVAVYHFESYLKAPDVEKEKRDSILRAIEWCTKYGEQESFSRIISGIGGVSSKKPIAP